MTHQHCWVTTDPTGGDPWMGGPVTIVVCADCGREQMDRPNAYEQGQRDALAAAVQRVEALANEMRNWSSAETTAATEAVPDLTFDQWLWVQRGVLRSIAAIKGDQP